MGTTDGGGRPGGGEGAGDPAETGAGGGEPLRLEGRLLEAVGQAVLATSADGTITYWNRAAERLYGFEASEILGANVTAIGSGTMLGDDPGEIWDRLMAGESYTGEFLVRHRSGAAIPVLITSSPVLDDAGAVVGTIAVSIDIADRVRAEAAARERAAQTAAVAAVGELAVTETSMRTLLDSALAHAVDALGADVGSILLVEGDHLRLHAAVGLPSELVGSHTVPLGDLSLAGFSLTEAGPTVVRDLAAEERFVPPPALLDAGVVSGVTAVLHVEGRGEGVLSVYTRDERRFDRDDLNVLRSIANVLAHAVERDRAHQRLARMAVTDELTGLPNRVLFLDRLDHALLQRSTQQVAVLFGDLDRFKDVNDALGHAAGDELLRAVADRLTCSVRTGDTVARFGGDEFAILSEGVSGVEEAMAVARRLAAAIAAEPVLVDGREIHVTISMGVVLADRHTADPADLLQDADAAMYRAKSAGRGRVELFDEHLRASVIERLDLTNQLVAAIPAGELVVHYQPEVALAGDWVWAEALVRWQHPERGLLMPAEFIDLAEDTGLIVPVGQLVLETAVRQMAVWAAMPPGTAPTAVAVNIAARQLVEDDLVARIGALLDDVGLDPSQLWLELTETALLREPEQAIETLHRLKALGIGLSIDDFGTGYSSLAYARLMPVDALKIDRSFVSGLGRDLRDEAVVRATIGLARSFGVLAVAEGVETQEQLDELTRLGCDMAQGYVLARPGTAEELEQWVAARSGQARG
jgi:diguanylate cyclase (GGDEF)-like protein/PAS domain S-box-containing protein